MVPEAVGALWAGSTRADRGATVAAGALQVLLGDNLRDVACIGEELLLEVEGWAVDEMLTTTAAHVPLPPGHVDGVEREMKRQRCELLSTTR
jgi:hypothetical protein